MCFDELEVVPRSLEVDSSLLIDWQRPVLLQTTAAWCRRTFSDPVHEVVDHAGDDCRCVISCKGTAHVATGDAKIILRSDNEPAILDLKRQAAAECRVRHEMTVINDDTTEYESQDNGLAEMAVREVKGVARTVRVALSELYNKDISSKHPVLPWLASYAAGQITRGQIGADLTPHQRLKGRAFRKLLPVFAE